MVLATRSSAEAAGRWALDAIAGQGEDRGKVSAALERDLWVGSLDPRTILVGWLGGACDITATLTVEPARVVLAEGPRHACDAVGIVKAVVVTFVASVDVTALEPAFVRAVPTP